MDDKAYEDKLLLLTKAMDKELQEAQLRALKAEAEVERLREENAEYVHRGLTAERAYEEAEAELEFVRAERDRFRAALENLR